MNILLRTLMILAVAAVVIGVTVALVQVPSVQTLITSGKGEQHGEFPGAGRARPQFQVEPASLAATATASDTDAARMERPEGRSGGSLLGLVEVVKNLAIVVVVTLVFATGSWLLGRLRPRRKINGPHAPPAAA